MKRHYVWGSFLSWSIVAAIAITLPLSSANAELLVYEPFDYDPGSPILGQGGTSGGFTGAWRVYSGGSVPTNSFITTGRGSLAHPSQPGDLPTVGNAAFLTGKFGTLQPARDFANIAGAAGTSTWISYIGQRQGSGHKIPPPHLRPIRIHEVRSSAFSTPNIRPRPNEAAWATPPFPL